MDVEFEGGVDAGMAEQHAHGLGVESGLDAASGEAVAQRMEIPARDSQLVLENIEEVPVCAGLRRLGAAREHKIIFFPA